MVKNPTKRSILKDSQFGQNNPLNVQATYELRNRYNSSNIAGLINQGGYDKLDRQVGWRNKKCTYKFHGNHVGGHSLERSGRILEDIVKTEFNL
jgi:hypothetical protein